MRAQPVAWDMHADKHISTEAFQLDYLVIKEYPGPNMA